MLTRNNNGEVVNEMNVSITQDGTVIRTNTMYSNGRPVVQNISVRDSQGDLTGKICTRWNERESTWRKSGTCRSRGTSQSKS